MILYVMRHAEAVEADDTLQEEWRYLTEKGRLAAEKVSAAVAKVGAKPRLTITSPLTRAVQTAEITAKNACRKNVIVTSGLLLPGADITLLITHLKSCKDLSKIASLFGHIFRHVDSSENARLLDNLTEVIARKPLAYTFLI